MAQAIVFGRVTTGLELKTSLKNNPYVMFSLAEHFGFGEAARTQFIQVWAWGHLAHQLVKCSVAKGSTIWVSGFLELSDYTRKDGVTKDKRLKLTLKDWGVSSRHRTIQARTCIPNRRNGGARSRTAHCRHHRR